VTQSQELTVKSSLNSIVRTWIGSVAMAAAVLSGSASAATAMDVALKA